MSQLTETRTEIYNFRDKAFQNAIQKIHDWDGNPRNKEILEEFLHELLHKGDTFATVGKLMMALRRLFTVMRNDADTLTTKELMYLLSWISSLELEDSTKGDYRKALKRFLLWRESLDERLDSNDISVRNEAIRLYKYLRANVKVTYKPKVLDPSTLINDEDFKIFIASAKNPMIEALIACLYFCGFRIGELMKMRIKHINIEDGCGQIWVSGKGRTQRKVPIVEALPYVQNWLKHHPDKDNIESLVWISRDARTYAKPLTYQGVRRALERVYERAGYLEREEQTPEQKKRKEKGRIKSLKKPINPHHWRKSCATRISCDLNESHLNEFMGWMQGSRQSHVYVHLSGDQTKNAYLASRGMLERKTPEPPNVKCNCGTLNPKSAKFCQNCNKPVSALAMFEDIKKRDLAINEAMQKWLEIMNDPELREKFEQFQRQSQYESKP